jgi:hypothetical protein
MLNRDFDFEIKLIAKLNDHRKLIVKFLGVQK